MKILCEISVRHVHLSQADVEALYGKGAKLERERDLSQPGQYLCKQRVTLIGPKREMENVAVLGPARPESQVELSRTDCFMLGLKNVPVRQSGRLDGTPGIVLKNGDKKVEIAKGVIIAKRHVHLDTKTAKENKFTDNEIVDLVFDGDRGAVLNETVVRVHDTYAPAVHIDSDEGNAVFAGSTVTIRKR